MNYRSWSVSACVTFVLLFASIASAEEWQRSAPSNAPDNPTAVVVVSDSCANYGILEGSVTGPGSTSGQFGIFTAPDSFIFTATGSGTGTWRIVGDPGGAQTLAAGGTFPGELAYSVPEGETIEGVGFYVDTYTGEVDTITGVCVGGAPAVMPANIPVPSLSLWSKMLMVMLLGLVGFAVFRRKQTQ